MEENEFRQHGKEVVDYIADYLENIRDVERVLPDVLPGYMRELLPAEAPQEGEQWEEIFKDFKNVVLPGVTHWQSPYMHAYFPALTSYPSMLGDMLANAINGIGFTWASSPACTELEIVVMDWLAKMLNLPECFQHAASGGRGGGVIQTTASEGTFVSLLAARTEAIRRQQNVSSDDVSGSQLNSQLVAYCSDQAHSSVEKAGLVGLVCIRYIETDEELSMRVDKLEEAILHDRNNGLIPFFLCATLGTTGACAFDRLLEVGPICEREHMWLHIDAAYAGSAFVCPEFRHHMRGIEFAHSLVFNPSKWLLTHFDCTAMWVRNSRALHQTFNVDPLYLQHENSGRAVDFMHWQVPLSRRFRALKLWFVIRSYGVKGLQEHIRKGVRLATLFEQLVKDHPWFEVSSKRHLGMVVFRMVEGNELTERLLKRLNSEGKMHAVPASLKGKYIIRFTVTNQRTTEEDVRRDFDLICQAAKNILEEEGVSAELPATKATAKTRVPLKETKKNEQFGSSLILANIGPNSAMSPKIINGSFAALKDLPKEKFKPIFQSLQEDPEKKSWMRRFILQDVSNSHTEAEKPVKRLPVWGPKIPIILGQRSAEDDVQLSRSETQQLINLLASLRALQTTPTLKSELTSTIQRLQHAMEAKH